MPVTERAALANVELATPPEWNVLDLERLEDTAAMRARIVEEINLLPGTPPDFSSRICELIATAAENDVIFAAVCAPGQGASVDLSAVTLALIAPQSTSTAHRSANQTVSETAPSAGVVQAQLAPSQNAAVLPAGRAARVESFELVDLGPAVRDMPVFCVEYAVAVPDGERFLVLTFTTIAPSDVDALRVQFSNIASTLTFE